MKKKIEDALARKQTMERLRSGEKRAVLTAEELYKVWFSMDVCNPSEILPEEAYLAVTKWANEVRFEAAKLELVMAGLVNVHVENGAVKITVPE